MAFVIFERSIIDGDSDNVGFGAVGRFWDKGKEIAKAVSDKGEEIEKKLKPKKSIQADPKDTTEVQDDPNDHSKDTPHEHALTADPKDTTPTTKHDFGSHAGAEEVAAATAVAGAIGVAAYNIYKRFFSTAAKACKDKSGSEKTDCMQEYKQKGTVAYNSLIQRNMGRCDKSKDPNACKESLRLKMKKGK